MKILYIANDRRIAEHAAAALRPVHPEAAVAWATGAIGALRWVDENRNVAAIIVEVESENPSLEWFLNQVRSSGVTAPVIVVSLKIPVPPLPALEAIADRVVPKTPTFLNELPQVVSRALQARQSISERSLRLLYVGEARLLRECVDEAGESVEVIQAAPGVDGRLDQLPTDCRPGAPLPFDILMIEHGYRGVETLEILRDVGLRRLPIPTVIVAEWDDELARVALDVGARDFIPRSQASFRTFVFRLKLLTAYAALLKEQSRPRDTHAFLRSSVVDDLGVRREDQARPREADRPSQKDTGDRRELESQLTSARAQIDQLREQLDAAGRVVEESRTLQQTEKATAAEWEQLERQLRATVTAAAEADQRAQSAMEGLRARETALQADVEQKLTEAEAKRQQAERVRELAETAFAEQLALHDAEHASQAAQAAREKQAVEERLRDAEAAIALGSTALEDVSALRQKLAQQHAEFSEHRARIEAEHAREAASRQAVEQQLADATLVLQRAEQRHALEMSDSASRLAEQRKQAAAGVSALQAKLVDSAATLQRIEQQAATDRQSAAEEAAQRQAKLDTALTQEVGRRQALAKQLTEAESSVQRAEQQHASEMTAAAQQLAAEQQRAETRLADAAAAMTALEARLVDSATAFSLAEQRAAFDRQAASEQALRQQAEFEAKLAQELVKRQALAKQLTDAEAAHQQLVLQHASEKTAAAERLDAEQRRSEKRLADAAAVASTLEARLVDSAAALALAEQRAALDRQAASEQALQRQTEFETQLAREVMNRQTVAGQLADAKAAHQRAEQRHSAEMSEAAAQLADHQKEADARLAQAAAEMAAVRTDLADTASALTRAQEQAAADRQAAVEEAAERQSRFDAAIAEETGRRHAIVKELTDAQVARERAEQQHAAQIAALDDHRTQAEAQLAQAAEAIEALRADLASAVAERTRAEQQAAEDLKATAVEAAERQAKFDTALEEEIAKGRALAKQMADAEAVHRRGEEQHASELAAANDRFAAHQAQAANDREAALKESAERQAAFDTALAEASTRRHALETQLAQALENAAVTLQAAEQRAESDRRTAAEEAVERQKEFEKALRAEAAQRQLVEQDLAATQAAAEEAERRFLEGVETMRQSAREHEARLEERAARERAEWESTLTERQERIEHLQMEGDLAVQSLVAREQEAQRLERKHKEERANLEQARATLEADLTRRHAEFAAIQQTLDEVRITGHATLERVVTESSTERARLEACVADRDRQLEEQAQQKETSDRALAEAEGRLRVMLEAHERDNQTIQQMQEQVTSLGKELESAVSHSELLKTEADRVPQLRKAIEDIQAANRHHFDHSATSMCRVSRDGAITQANHAFVKLLGYDTPEQLQNVDFAATVFEVGDELPWIIDRCLTSRSTESIETAWKTKDGGRVIVRLVAVAASPDSIDLAVQDLTPLRALEEKLNNAQRLEAVARYASEVAFTCEKLLEDVQRDGQEWLPSVAESARRQGQLLLDEVTRATGFLKQLTVYGKEQVNAPELVDVKKVLRDLEPVLKRVAGGNIELVLPKASTPHNLDVEQERVERILVNVAAYGRERMRTGGRLMIEVASVVVDRNFVAKYPNVRPGGHVLLTVTEKNGVPHPDGQLAVPSQAAGANLASSERPGIDLGALQALIDNCGGHLWMTAEPPGDMVLKIHLPRRVLDDGRPAKASGPSRWISRLPGIRH